MAVMRIYEKNGTNVATFSGITGVTFGALEYAGGSFFYVNPVRTGTIAYGDASGFRGTKALWSNGTGNSGRGVALSHSQLSQDTEYEFQDGGLMYTVREVDQSGTLYGYVELRERNGTIVKSINFTGILAMGGCAFDGKHLAVSVYYSVAGGVTAMNVYDAQLNSLYSFAVSAFIIDMTFDGQYYWSVDGTNTVNQWEITSSTTRNIYKSWTASGATIRGIATDGDKIWILSDT